MGLPVSLGLSQMHASPCGTSGYQSPVGSNRLRYCSSGRSHLAGRWWLRQMLLAHCTRWWEDDRQGEQSMPRTVQPNLYAPHFDIAVPGFDWGPASVSNVCQTSPRNCDPGVNSGICSHGSIGACNCNSVSSDPVLQQGCRLFQQLPWGDNPNVQMQDTSCPGAEHFLAMNGTTVVV